MILDSFLLSVLAIILIFLAYLIGKKVGKRSKEGEIKSVSDSSSVSKNNADIVCFTKFILIFILLWVIVGSSELYRP